MSTGFELLTELITKFRNKTDSAITFDKESILSYNSWQQNWKLGRCIFEGGQGSVYNTTTKLNYSDETQKCITKVYKFDTDMELRRIFTEYKIFKELKLLNYYAIAYGANNKEIYLTMEKLNYTLFSAVATHPGFNLFYDVEGNLNEERLKYFVLDLAEILLRLHRRGYTHFDVKPRNIMWRWAEKTGSTHCQNGWKIIDGGFMTYTGGEKDFVQISSIKGSFGYTAPEMDINNFCNNITNKVDVWSLGVTILYIINNGTNIFHVTKQEVIENKLETKEDIWKYYYYEKLKGPNQNGEGDYIIMNHVRVQLSDIQYKISLDLCDLLSLMLKYDPDKRLSMIDVVSHHWFQDVRSKDGKWNKSKMIAQNIDDSNSNEALCLNVDGKGKKATIV